MNFFKKKENSSINLYILFISTAKNIEKEIKPFYRLKGYYNLQF
jgi:hypothetical protein